MLSARDLVIDHLMELLYRAAPKMNGLDLDQIVDLLLGSYGESNGAETDGTESDGAKSDGDEILFSTIVQSHICASAGVPEAQLILKIVANVFNSMMFDLEPDLDPKTYVVNLSDIPANAYEDAWIRLQEFNRDIKLDDKLPTDNYTYFPEIIRKIMLPYLHNSCHPAIQKSAFKHDIQVIIDMYREYLQPCELVLFNTLIASVG